MKKSSAGVCERGVLRRSDLRDTKEISQEEKKETFSTNLGGGRRGGKIREGGRIVSNGKEKKESTLVAPVNSRTAEGRSGRHRTQKRGGSRLRKGKKTATGKGNLRKREKRIHATVTGQGGGIEERKRLRPSSRND